LAVVGAVTIALVYMTLGFRHDVIAGEPTPMLGVTSGLLILLAAAAGAGAVRMARPQVGAPASGAPWVLAALLLVPMVALFGVVTQPALVGGLDMHQGLRCLALGLVAGLGTFAFLAAWLRQGAPVSPERASWLVGLAAGATGALANSLECPQESLAHLAIWHLAAVPVAAVAARIVLPRLLRW
ncbi:NrsF family protein, partial [Sphingomonas sp.]|uniref:NrsF family protein n=1 Tax=Sphingomonas sp. TaxID=28214 RepID=UPI0025E6D74C